MASIRFIKTINWVKTSRTEQIFYKVYKWKSYEMFESQDKYIQNTIVDTLITAHVIFRQIEDSSFIMFLNTQRTLFRGKAPGKRMT